MLQAVAVIANMASTGMIFNKSFIIFRFVNVINTCVVPLWHLSCKYKHKFSSKGGFPTKKPTGWSFGTEIDNHCMAVSWGLSINYLNDSVFCLMTALREQIFKGVNEN